MSEEGLKEKIIIECSNKDCRHKLRIPKTTDTLRVSCPRCGTSFLYPTPKIYKKKTSNRIKNHPIFFGLIITLGFLLVANRYLMGVWDLNSIFLIIGICFILWFIGTWVMDRFKETDTRWYYQKWFVFLILLIFPPLGITLLWAGSKFKKPWKAILTLLFGSWFVFSVLSYQPGEFFYSPREEMVRLFSTQKEEVYLKLASQYVKDNFREVILSNKISPLTVPFTIPQIIIGDSDKMQVGERVLAIGNPYGWENTISDGLFSGMREIGDFKLLQITAPVSPGSSGGALFNMKGEVIGIITIGSQWGAQNLNFAIPINTLKLLIRERQESSIFLAG